MIFSVAPRYGRQTPIVYISICSLVGSVSVMSIKGFGIAVKLTLSGSNQFSHPSTYVFMIVTTVCILVQMNYFNKALDLFSTNVFVTLAWLDLSLTYDFHSVNPMYYVGFTTCTIVASTILFQGFNTTDPANTISLIVGFIVIFLGVHLLNISRNPDPPPPPSPTTGERHHLPLEHGFTNPRMSVGGRLSIDSNWSGGGPPSATTTPRRATQSRTNGFGHPYRANSLSGPIDEEGAVGMTKLRAVEEYDDDDDDDGQFVDERTGLTESNHPTPTRPSRGKRKESEAVPASPSGVHGRRP